MLSLAVTVTGTTTIDLYDQLGTVSDYTLGIYSTYLEMGKEDPDNSGIMFYSEKTKISPVK